MNRFQRLLQKGLEALLASLLLALLLLAPPAALFLLAPPAAQAQLHSDNNSPPVVRSIESLRDLDYQSWQLVAYREGPPGGPLILRIVGYPGKVRLDHPTALRVKSGRQHWDLEDVTLANPQLLGDGRAAAAEFDLAPLLADLKQDRPLRLALNGVFVELPVPPFVVEEWRSLAKAKA
ncbi:DUF3122 domain-containing protein [Cyanobium sp. HWJ4-Hawea]|uniref:DUF3122 domain-containing protein n=1 Tax=Cyanobium sp. HWJ4-Hawea TaxID=2823713 RepID=UPI0020CE15F0|nr:DUF3122 domain-containing protein [Cyanobium sp. HWJ4-Hawea]MCP9808031.1 DUF3122 domain-containing protein [Cyanobium sp. HWJ4-Hawea]